MDSAADHGDRGRAGAGSALAKADSSGPDVRLTKYEALKLDKVKKQGQQCWQDDDLLKNFPAARSAALKLCDSGDKGACADTKAD